MKAKTNNVLDAYLTSNSTTRYQVAQTGQMSASNLARIVKSPAGLKNMTVRVIEAIAYTIDKEPGTVLNEMLKLEREFATANLGYPIVIEELAELYVVTIPDLDITFKVTHDISPEQDMNSIVYTAQNFIRSIVGDALMERKPVPVPTPTEEVKEQNPRMTVRTIPYSEGA